MKNPLSISNSDPRPFKACLLTAALFMGVLGAELFFLPIDRFTFRPWECAVIYHLHRLLPGYFYPNLNFDSVEIGDLHRFMKNRIPRKVHWVTDAHGYRNRPRASDQYPIVIVGSSFTGGSGLTQSDTLAEQLERFYGKPVYAMARADLSDFLDEPRFEGTLAPKVVVLEVTERQLNYLSAPPVKKPAAPDIKSAFFDQLRRFPAVWITVDRALKSPLRRYLRSRLDDAKTDLAVFLEKDFTALRGGTKLDAEKNRLETFRVLQTFNEFLWSGKIVRLRDSSGLSYYRVADSVNADERERVAKVLLTYRESLLHLRNESATPSSEPLNIKKIVEDAGGCKEALQKRGIDFVLLPVPDRANYFVGRGIRVYAPADPFGPLFASLKEAGITAVNLPETYARAHQYNVELFQPDDSHWSRKGVAIAAKGIANILEQA